MARKNALTAWVLFFAPVLVVYMLENLLTPLQLAFEEYPNFNIGTYAIAFGLGFYLFRRSRLVKDHEWQRQQALKAVSHQFKAEDSGVWNRDVAVPEGLGAEGESALTGKAGELSSEKETKELEHEDQRDVNLLLEAEHVVKATRRVTGDETFDDEVVDSTVGAVRQPSPMDRLLDWFARKFSGVDKATEREIRRKENLTGEPVKAERISFDEVTEEANSPSSDNPEPAPEPKPEPTAEPVQVDPEAQAIYGSSGESLEAMAGMVTAESAKSSAYNPSPSGAGHTSGYAVNRCGTCGHSNAVEARYCDGCGSSL